MQYPLVLVSVLSCVHVLSVPFHDKPILSLFLLLIRCFNTCAYYVALMVWSLDLLAFAA